MEDEIGKYLKRKPSNVSKSKNKSKHKHKYSKCVLISENNWIEYGEYCTICGKVSNRILAIVLFSKL